jgi:predicted ribosomally synthesized peptide with SipW-like signal peptide
VETTAVRSVLVASVTDLDHIATDLDVIGTNLLLALILLLAIGVTSALFNATLEENRPAIEGWVQRASGSVRTGLAPLLQVARGPVERLPRTGRAAAIGRIALVLVLTALIYGFLSPDFGLDGRSLIMFVSLMVGLGIVTYIAEGGSVVVSNMRLHALAGVRVYGVALSIAVGSVVISRIVDFKPGVLYGFVASAVLLAPASLGRRQRAEVVLLPTLVLLFASLTAWLVLVPIRAAGGAETSWSLGLVEAVAAIVFVAGLEGAFFNMIPIDFMDGAEIARWNRPVWALVFGVSGFLFWHLLLNQNKAYLAAFAETKVVAAFTVVGLFSVATVVLWVYFHLAARRDAVAG